MSLTNEQKTEVINRLDNLINRAVEGTMGCIFDTIKDIRRIKADAGFKNKDIIPIVIVPNNYMHYRILLSEYRIGIIETMAKVKIAEVAPFTEDEVDDILERLAVGYGLNKEN